MFWVGVTMHVWIQSGRRGGLDPTLEYNKLLYVSLEILVPGADPGFLERGFICIKVWGLALLILSHFY